ncbi:hypothetical protein AB4089_17165 [Arthrobacter sp. 2MCAF15]|uniref:hypothetical protein n=1 Tax=Arthrobacter sp. 2MCAF15 TaxID=3232984 RepID=UPI003F90EBDD
MHGNIEKFPLAQIRDHPDDPVFRKRHINPPAPDFTGFVNQQNDWVPWRKQQEGIDFTSRERVFGSTSSRREAGSGLPQ